MTPPFISEHSFKYRKFMQKRHFSFGTRWTWDLRVWVLRMINPKDSIRSTCRRISVSFAADCVRYRCMFLCARQSPTHLVDIQFTRRHSRGFLRYFRWSTSMYLPPSSRNAFFKDSRPSIMGLVLVLLSPPIISSQRLVYAVYPPSLVLHIFPQTQWARIRTSCRSSTWHL